MTKVKTALMSSFIVAIIAEIFLMFIIYFNPYKIEPLLSIQEHLTINQTFNALSALFLIAAVVAIKKYKCQKTHKIFIHLALASSAVFLISYIFYHLSVGHVTFNNLELRSYYLFILISHLVTSFLVLPLIFATYTLGFMGEFDLHKLIAKPTAICWLYVSLTGVLLVYFLKNFHTWK